MAALHVIKEPYQNDDADYHVDDGLDDRRDSGDGVNSPQYQSDDTKNDEDCEKQSDHGFTAVAAACKAASFASRSLMPL